MKIAFIKRHFSYYGGAERYLNRLLEALKNKAKEIHIFANNWTADKDLIFHKVPILSFGSFLKAYTFNRNLKINLREFDCVISFERTLNQHIYRAGEGCHIRWLQIRSIYEPFWKRYSFKLNPLHKYYLMVEKQIFKETPLIIANSKMIKNEIVHYYGIPPSKIKVIYNGIDTLRFLPSNGKEIKKSILNPCPKGKIILFVGSGFERKGLINLLKALSLLKNEKFLLFVIGKGNIKKYREISKVLGILDKIHFYSTTKEIEKFYAVADIFVLPTLYDPFSNATLEAMASGLPVITTVNNGASELIEEGKEGFIIQNPLNYREITEKIEFALKEKEKMGECARKKAEQFTIERAARDFFQCIEKFSS